MLPDSTTISLLFPEIILIAMATFIFVAGAFRPQPSWWPILAILTYIATLFAALLRIEWQFWESLVSRQVVASGPLSLDYLGQLLRPMTLILGLLLSLLLARSAPRSSSPCTYMHCLVSSICVLVSATITSPSTRSTFASAPMRPE